MGLDLFEVLRRSGMTDPCAEAAMPDSPIKPAAQGPDCDLLNPNDSFATSPLSWNWKLIRDFSTTKHNGTDTEFIGKS